MVAQGQIGVAQSRQEALEHFAAGETAFFIDWTQAEAQRSAVGLERAGVELVERPYPSSSGESVRAFEVIGAAVFRSERSAQALLSLTALRRLTDEEQAWLMPQERAIWRDGAQWLPPLDASDAGSTLRRLLARAIGDVLAGEQDAGEAERGIRAAMRALQ